MCRGACQHLWCLALLIVVCCWGQYCCRVIGPASYLDVINAPPGSRSAALNYTGRVLGSCRSQGRDGSHESCRITSNMGSEEQLTSRTGHQSLANPKFSPPYNVCVSDWQPMVKCTAGPEVSETPFKGYQIELFRLLAQQVGWTAEDYKFTCMDWTDLMEDLRSDSGLCSMTASGVQVTNDLLSQGIKFSWPTYKSGLRIMIHADLVQGSTWAFLEGFHWSVWISLGATGLAVGFAVAFIEWATPEEVAGPRRDHGKGWQAWTWYSLAKLMHVVSHVGDPATDASRILVLGYGFLVLVMVSMYTASSASSITAERLAHPVHSMKDLKGRSVITWDAYVAKLKYRHGITATGHKWEGEADFEEMLTALKEDKYDALVLDTPVLEYTAGTNHDCNLFLVGETFETFVVALAFPAGFNDSIIFAFSTSMVKLQTEQGSLDMLESVYIKTGGTAKCFSSSGGSHGGGDPIQLRQLSGLWYILCIAIAICFIMTIIHNMRKKRGRVKPGHAKAPSHKLSGPGTIPKTPESTVAAAAVIADGSNARNPPASPAHGNRPRSHSGGGGGEGEWPVNWKSFLGLTPHAYREEEEDEHGRPSSHRRRHHTPKTPKTIKGLA